MAKAKCFFCGCEQEDYLGVYLIKNDGNVVYICSSKCRKSYLKLKRDRTNVRWTDAWRIGKKKREESAGEVAEKVKLKKEIKEARKKTLKKI